MYAKISLILKGSLLLPLLMHGRNHTQRSGWSTELGHQRMMNLICRHLHRQQNNKQQVNTALCQVEVIER